MQALAGLNEEDALDAAIAKSLGLATSPDAAGMSESGAALPPEAGVSFANIAKMGFAATGPKLSPAAPETGSLMFCAIVSCTMSADVMQSSLHVSMLSYCQSY